MTTRLSTSASFRTYSALRFLLLLGSSCCCIPNTTTATMALVTTSTTSSIQLPSQSQQCFYTRDELTEALSAYLRDNNNNDNNDTNKDDGDDDVDVDTTINSSSSSTDNNSIDTWCVSNIPDDISDLRMDAELNFGLELDTSWTRECDCPTAAEEKYDDTTGREGITGIGVVVVEHDTKPNDAASSSSSSSSSPVRSASDTATATATPMNAATGSSSSKTNKDMPMIYRVVPVKLLAILLVLSLGMAIRYMADFHRYEGIDPSDQKIVEFELLQLAEEA
ncbi:hypothetical protein IV203_003468 [Nitzschia inconspicua]|uniref:Uncharacterized protein n=1 Tax=Nitzschia inconspicua TaxID=303405 RepID=A0A9K3L2B8_9STRA|nr:hypothetical protein IV203_003468 [Nitzschia inconspicua]